MREGKVKALPGCDGLTALGRVVERAGAPVGLPRLLDEAAAEVAGALQADVVGILEIDRTGTDLVLRAGHGWPAAAPREPVQGETPAAWVLRTGEPVTFGGREAGRPSGLPTPLAEHGVRSGIVVPLEVDGKLRGALAAYRRRPWRAGDEEVGLLRLFAHVVCAAMERDRARRDLRAARGELGPLRILVGGAADLLLGLDTTGTIRAVSPSVTALLGYTPDEVTGASVFDYLAPEDEAAAVEAFGQVLEAGGEPIAIALRARHKTGGLRLFEAVGRAVAGPEAGWAVTVVARDVTRRRRLDADACEGLILDAIGRLASGVADVLGDVLDPVARGDQAALGRARALVERLQALARPRREAQRRDPYAAVARVAAATAPPPGARRDAPTPPAEVAAVLVADPDPAARGLVRRVLGARGVHVLEAGSGEEALRLAAGDPERLDLLVASLGLPDMGARELAERLVAARGTIGCVFVSEHPYGSPVERSLLDAGAVLLQRPFTPEQLLAALARARRV